MSYARWGDDSDVYVYGSDEDTLHCVMCLLVNGKSFTGNLIEMRDHLIIHTYKEHKVPARAIKRLEDEIAELVHDLGQ